MKTTSTMIHILGKMIKMRKSYSELIEIPSFDERIEYLKTHSRVGEATFGDLRSINQRFYKSPEWLRVKRLAILRDTDFDNVLDLAHSQNPILDDIIHVHHITPITAEDIVNGNPMIFDLENLVCCSMRTHKIIHYELDDGILRRVANRRPNDTTPWL